MIRLLSILTTLFIAIPVFAASAENTVRYYPGGGAGIEVGKEEFLKNYASLAGIEGAYVNLDYVIGSSEKNNIELRDDLEEQVRKRFEDAGLKFLTKEEHLLTPGMPEMAVYPSYTGGGLGADVPNPLDARGVDVINTDCCRNSVWMSFSQSATILRRPDSHFKLGTWGAGDDSKWCENRGQWMYDAVLKTIDLFIEDYKQAETEKKPLKIETAEQVPANCAQSWAVHLQVFDTNSTEIMGPFVPILDKLVGQAKRCGSYSYIIETHADRRSTDAYNKILSEARAASIKEYLMARGIEYSRLKSIAYGESKPLSMGNTEADHAANRRVVIIPNLGPIVSSQKE